MHAVSPVFVHSDGRGSLQTLFNNGQWKEVNYLESHAGVTRGGHYHKTTTEMVFMLEGSVEVTIEDLRSRAKQCRVLKSFDMIVIEPFELHSFRTLAPCRWLNLLSQPFDQEAPDIHRPDERDDHALPLAETADLLLTGGSGYVGQYLQRQLSSRFRILSLDRTSGHDLTCPERVRLLFEQVKPRLVIHCANFGNIRQCEADPPAAYAVNVIGTSQIVSLARAADAYFVFLSSDYVFDGIKGWYRETDAPRPTSVFGRTKWEAETEITRIYPEGSLILRPAGVYGYQGRKRSNWDLWALDRLSANEPVEAFTDIFNSPTWIGDLLRGIECCLESKPTGIYHLAGSERVSRYDFFRRLALSVGLPAALVRPIRSEGMEEVHRPKDVSLVSERLEKALGLKLVGVEEGLARSRYHDPIL